MHSLRIACVLVFVVPAIAADPAVPADKPPVTRLYHLHTPCGWLLHIHSDGSGHLMFGAGPGDLLPAGTFKVADVRKALSGMTFEPKGALSSHYSLHVEEERKAGHRGPPAWYTRDEKVIVPLFEKAAAARKGKASDKLLELLGRKRPSFGLKN